MYTYNFLTLRFCSIYSIKILKLSQKFINDLVLKNFKFIKQIEDFS